MGVAIIAESPKAAVLTNEMMKPRPNLRAMSAHAHDNN